MQAEFEIIAEDVNSMTIAPVKGSNNCSLCKAGGGCGMRLFGSISHPVAFKKERVPGVKKGDYLTLNFSIYQVYRHAFMGYIAPLLALIVASGISLTFVAPGNESLSIFLGSTAFIATIVAFMRFKEPLQMEIT